MDRGVLRGPHGPNNQKFPISLQGWVAICGSSRKLWWDAAPDIVLGMHMILWEGFRNAYPPNVPSRLFIELDFAFVSFYLQIKVAKEL